MMSSWPTLARLRSPPEMPFRKKPPVNTATAQTVSNLCAQEPTRTCLHHSNAAAMATCFKQA